MSRNVVSCTSCTGHGNDFELIPTVQMESQHSVGWSTCHKFPRFFNHFGEIAAWSPKSLKTVAQKIAFSEKRPLGQIFNNVFRKDSCGHRTTSCVQISWNLADRKSANSCVIYRTKNKFQIALPLSLLRGSRPTSVRASSRQYTRSVPNFIRIRLLPAEL